MTAGDGLQRGADAYGVVRPVHGGGGPAAPARVQAGGRLTRFAGRHARGAGGQGLQRVGRARLGRRRLCYCRGARRRAAVRLSAGLQVRCWPLDPQ